MKNSPAPLSPRTGLPLSRLSRVRNGYSVDTATGIVYSVGGTDTGYVTHRWMFNHGYVPR